jgi:hypothetical protein
VVADTNGDGLTNSVHHDHDDWAAVDLGGLGDNDGARVLTEPEIITEPPVPAHARN